MINYIVVASKEEKKALIPEKYWDITLISGIGMLNTLQSLKFEGLFDHKRGYRIINIGFAGSKGIDVGTICEVDTCEPYQAGDILQGVFPLNRIVPDLGIPKHKLYTATDFVKQSDLKAPFLIDMELLAYYPCSCPVMSIKIVSDNLDFDSYNNVLEKDYTKQIGDILERMGI